MSYGEYFEYVDPSEDPDITDASNRQLVFSDTPRWTYAMGRQPVRERWDLGTRNYYFTYVGSYPFDALGFPSNDPTITGREFCEWAGEYVDTPGEPADQVPFHHYIPHHGLMNPEQLDWYLYWREEARQGTYLPTSDSYLFVHAFELINGFGVADPADALDQLLKLWHAYQSESVAVRLLLWQWIEDTALMHELMPLDNLYAAHIGAWRSAPYTDHVIEFYGTQPLNNMPLSMIDLLGESGLAGLRVHQLGHGELLRWFVPLALAAIDEQIRGTNNRGIFKRYGPRSRHEIDRYVYTGALYNGPRRDVFLPPVRHFGDVRGKLPDTLFAVARNTESQLRKPLKIHGRPGRGYLDPKHVQIIEGLIADQFSIHQELLAAGAIEAGSMPRMLERPRPTVTLRKSSIQRHNRDADRARDLLLDGLELEAVNNTAPTPSPSLPSSPSSTGESGWEHFGSQLTNTQRAVLTLMVREPNPIDALNQLSRTDGVMPAQLLDGLNELAVDLVGDAIIDLGVDPPVLYDDYRDELDALITQRKD